MSAKKWTALCPNCGTQTITQERRPTVCKQQVKFGKRSFRQCRRELLSVGVVTNSQQKALL